MTPPGGLEGILLVDKPAGWTSHDVVARARRMTGQRRIGHTGTLDPMATGLLVLCLGRATRLVEHMAGHDKAYSGEIVLGAATDTDDAEGRVIAEAPVPPLAPGVLRALEARFTGELLQRPPAYSALKTGGRRAYDIARRGGDPGLARRTVRVLQLHLAQLAPARLRIDVRCSAGTYIRSLARDIGEALGCGAHLGALRRTAAGPFTVGEAWLLADIERFAAAGTAAEALLEPDEGVLELPAAILGLEHRRDLEQGRLVAVPPDARSPAIRLYDIAGDFAGIGAASEGLLRGRKMLLA